MPTLIQSAFSLGVFVLVLAQNPIHAQQPSSQAVQHALKLENAGDLNAALAAWQQLIKENPKNADYQVQLAGCEYKQGRFRETLNVLSKVLQKEPSNLNALRSRVHVYLALKENDKALADSQKCLKIKPNDIDSMYAQALCYKAQGQLVEALFLLNKVTTVKPEFYPAYSHKAFVESQLKRPYKALNDFTTAIEHDSHPDYSWYLERARCNLALKLYDAAVPDLNTAIGMAPKERMPRALHALSLVVRDPKRAQAEIQDVIAKNPGKVDVWQVRYELATKLLDWNGVEKSLRTIIQLDPQNTEAKTNLANLPSLKARIRDETFKRGATADQTLADLEQAVRKNPKDSDALLRRGNFYLKNLDADHAVSDFTSIIKLNPKLEYGYIRRGTAYMSLERYDKAFNDFDQALKINPASIEGWLASARLHRSLKQLEAALRDYGHLIALRPEASQFLTERSAIYSALNKPDLALKDAEKAVELSPGYVELKARGNAFLAAGQYRKAADDLTAAIAFKSTDYSLYRSRAAAYQKLGQVALAKEDLGRIKNFDDELFDNAPFWQTKPAR